MEKFESSLDKLIDGLIQQIPSLIAALLILVIGRFVIRFSLSIIDKRFEKRDVDISIRSFIKSIVKFALYCLLILTVASTLGIQTTSFIAALSAFGLAVGMALQGSLSNFAGGVLILVFRPFEVGDYVASDNGAEGTIEQIDILYTTMVNADGIRVFSPNGTLANSVIKNYTRILSRRFQFVVGISYDDNIKDAKETILQVLNGDDRVEKNPAAEVFVSELADSSVNLTVRGWASKDKFWATNNSLQEKVKNALDDKGISIPYPQSEMRIKSDPSDGAVKSIEGE